MTLYDPIPLACPLCGAVSEQLVLLSTSFFGASDLDMRLARPARYAHRHDLADCPECQYVFATAAKQPEPRDSAGARGVMESAQYRDAGPPYGLPKLAQRFYRGSLLALAEGDNAEAGWRLVKAAWECDDEGSDEVQLAVVPLDRRVVLDVAAVQLRLAAAAQFGRARELGQRFARGVNEPVLLFDLLQPGLSRETVERYALDAAEALLVADLLRRAGRFDEALEECLAAQRLDDGRKLGEPIDRELAFIGDRETRAQESYGGKQEAGE